MNYNLGILEAEQAAVNKEHMKLWIAALRSGDFQQIRGSLESFYNDMPGDVDFLVMDKPGQCCLGVACHVAMKDGLKLKYLEPEKRVGGEAKFDGDGTSLPLPVMEWLGLNYPDPPVRFKDTITSCISLNDAFKLSFVEIAFLLENTYIEEYPGR